MLFAFGNDGVGRTAGRRVSRFTPGSLARWASGSPPGGSTPLLVAGTSWGDLSIGGLVSTATFSVEVPAVAPTRTATRLHRPPVDLEVIIPVLNEQNRLPRTLAVATSFLADRGLDASIVVVDNGSVDRTVDVAVRGSARVPVHLLGCSAPGKGAAVRRGILTGSSRVVGFMDADLATPMETLEAVLPLLAAGHAAVVASRHIDGSSMEVEQGSFRQLGGRAFRTISRLAVPKVADTQCGFKFFDGRIARDVAADCVVDGFAFDVELLARIIAAGHEVVEVPVRWTDVDGSTFSATRDGLRSMWDALQVRRLLQSGGGR